MFTSNSVHASSVGNSCLTLCDPMDYSPPGASVHRIFQARILEWVATSSSRGPSGPKDGTSISWIGRWILYHWTTCPRSNSNRLKHVVIEDGMSLWFLNGRTVVVAIRLKKKTYWIVNAIDEGTEKQIQQFVKNIICVRHCCRLES